MYIIIYLLNSYHKTPLGIQQLFVLKKLDRNDFVTRPNNLDVLQSNELSGWLRAHTYENYQKLSLQRHNIRIIQFLYGQVIHIF